MVSKLGGALAVAVALSLMPATATAHDHKRPRVLLRTPGDRQTGRPWSWGWTSRTGENTCQSVIADGIPNYTRPAMKWRPGRRIHLRLFKRHKPTRLVIRMYVRLDDEFDVPAGRPRRADYRLRRVRLTSGRRIWIAGFFGRRTTRHLYLEVHARYRDVEGCGGSQTMELAFHLRLRRHGAYGT